MKKIFLGLLLLIMIFSVTGCYFYTKKTVNDSASKIEVQENQ